MIHVAGSGETVLSHIQPVVFLVKNKGVMRRKVMRPEQVWNEIVCVLASCVVRVTSDQTNIRIVGNPSLGENFFIVFVVETRIDGIG